MGKEVARNMELAGPSISGTVTVTLLELDRMRADHANAVKLAEDLKEKAMSVKVTIIEKKDIYDWSSRGAGNRFLRDTKYEELSVEWRNLEDFRGIIHQEEHDKVHEEILQGVRLAQRLEDETVAKEKMLAKTHSDLTEVKRVNGELILAGEELKKEVESLKADNELWKNKHEDCLEDLKKQTSISEGINERLKLALKETDYWRAKKSIWFRWFGL